MGITNSSKQISSHRMDCEGTIKVTLALSAAPDIRFPSRGYSAGAKPVRRYGRHSF